MKKLLILAVIIFTYTNIFAQSNLQKVYDTEKAFEKSAAEKGINDAFIEYLAPDSTIFVPERVNGREFWKNSPKSAAAIYWNPTFVDVSSNGVMAYTTGNSVYKAKGKDDPSAIYGEYATVWQRQPNGNYLAVLDLGISHAQSNNETKWISPPDSGRELNEKKYSAADYSTAFFEAAAKQGLSKAYKTFLANDARLLREGKMPIIGKENALKEFKNDKSKIVFTKRSFFVGAADMAYISNTYTATDKNDKLIEKGNFLQVWKLRGNRWEIVLDAFVPIPAEKN